MFKKRFKTGHGLFQLLWAVLQQGVCIVVQDGQPARFPAEGQAGGDLGWVLLMLQDGLGVTAITSITFHILNKCRAFVLCLKCMSGTFEVIFVAYCFIDI